MNKFFEFKKYNSHDRKYKKPIWEPTKVESFRMLPFQYEKSESGVFQMYQDNTNITDLFFDGANKITSWTESVGVTLSSSGSTILSLTNFLESEYVRSNNIALTEGDLIYIKIDGTITESVTINILDGATSVKTVTGVTDSIELSYTAESTTNYVIEIVSEDDATEITNAVCECYDSVLKIYDTNYVIYSGSILYGMLDNGSCSFEARNSQYNYVTSDYVIQESFITDTCDVGCVNEVINFPDATGSGRAITLADSTDYDSSTISVNKGDVITLYLNSNDFNFEDTSDFECVLIMSGYSNVTMTATQKADTFWYYTGTAQASGELKIRMTSEFGNSVDINFFEVTKGYSSEVVKLALSSSVDYGGVHYSDGWKQWIYKSADLRRSPSSDITIVGDEENGEIVVEKRIAAIKYSLKMKCTESEHEALVHAMAGDVELTDQSGKTYNAINKELNEPTWYFNNGIIEMTFIDENNINVYTLNNSDV